MSRLDARRILREAPRATDRARAALAIGPRAAEPAFVYALLDAVYDPKPRVRHAAVSVLRHAMIPENDASDEARALVARIALEDPVWWVRRAAVASLAAAGPSAVATLVSALDDPFWRVRWAAVLVLAALDVAAVVPALEVADRLRSDRANSAAELLRRRLGLAPRTLASTDALPTPAALDADPAVTTARMEAGEPFSPAVLVDCLGDPHLPLRRCAIDRLAAGMLDAKTIELALLWLEEPRIPHAAAAVFRLFDRVGDETHRRAVEIAIDHGAPGAIAWALSTGAVPRARVERLATHPHPRVRRAVAAALERPPTGMLGDVDEDVVRIAAAAMLATDPDALRPLCDRYARQPRLLRRVLATAAIQQGWDDVVARAADDPDRSIAALAVAAQCAGFDAATRARYAGDGDPDLRAAVFEPARAAAIAETDDDLGVLRRALSVRPDPAIGRAAAESRHPEIRRLAARHLEGHDAERLVRLAGDADRAVRAAAFAALAKTAPVDAVLPALVARAEATPPKRARPALGAPRAVATRPLGKGGLAVAPLVVSGVGGLRVGDYARAFNAGCTHFFHEPRYRELGLFLRRERRAGVVAGTYDAGPEAIRAGVERTLRRLRRDVLDVVLLFWTRSEHRLEGLDVLARLREAGKVRAIGVSTHDRALAVRAMERPIDVVMVRHSAMHPGAEIEVFPTARAKGIGVLAFSTLSYGRLVRGGVPASEAYRFSMFAPGVTACVSAPYAARELDENLALLESAPLSAERANELRAIGRQLHAESTDFGRLVRRFPMVAPIPDHEPAREEWDPWNPQPLAAD